MVKVFTSQELHDAQFVQNVLKDHGIQGMLKNEFSNLVTIGRDSTMWPEVYVDERDQARALELIEELQNQPAGVPWNCPECKEAIEGQFDSCWNCGAERPAS